MEKNISEEHLEDLGWAITMMRLDRELPLRNNRRRIFYWFLMLSLVALSVFGYFYYEKVLDKYVKQSGHVKSTTVESPPEETSKMSRNYTNTKNNTRLEEPSEKDTHTDSNKEQIVLPIKSNSGGHVSGQTNPSHRQNTSNPIFARSGKKKTGATKQPFLSANHNNMEMQARNSVVSETDTAVTASLNTINPTGMFLSLTPLVSMSYPHINYSTVKSLPVQPVKIKPVSHNPLVFVLAITGEYNLGRYDQANSIEAGLLKKWKNRNSVFLGVRYTFGWPEKHSYIQEVLSQGRTGPQTQLVENTSNINAAGFCLRWDYMWHSRWSWGMMTGFQYTVNDKKETIQTYYESTTSPNKQPDKERSTRYFSILPEYYAGVHISGHLSRQSAIRVSYQLSSIDITTRTKLHYGKYFSSRWLPGEIDIGYVYNCH